MVQDAILMRLHEIGENLARVRRLDEERFVALGAPSWNSVIGLRNIIAHGYRTVDKEEVWRIISAELAPFAESLNVLDQWSSTHDGARNG